MSKFRVASLFAGAGGLDLGFKNNDNFEIVWANDIDDDAVATYRENIGTHIVPGSISEIKSDSIPDCDVVLGGFPCQGFSVANTGRREDDERNSLYLEMLRVVEDKKPKIFVAENVKGLTYMEKGRVLERIVSDFNDAGYNTRWKVLNAADYGVPQKRERVFIVGVRKDLNFEFVYPDKTHSKEPSYGKKAWVTVGEALAAYPDPDSDHNVLNHTYSKYKLRFNGYIGHRSIDPSQPAPTVTGRGDNRGGVVVLHHPSNERRMSVRELARVQSFPDSFFFPCNQSAAYRLIGNAVAPRVAFAVARQVQDLLQSAEERTYSYA